MKSGSTLRPKDDPFFYYLQESDITRLNMKQSCLAQLPVSKTNPDTSYYGDYNVKVGSRIYAGRADTAPRSITEVDLENTVTITAPELPDLQWDPMDGIDETIEYKFQEAGMVEKTKDLSTVGLTGTAT